MSLSPRAGQSQHWISYIPSPRSPALGGLRGATESGEEKLRVRAGLRMKMQSKELMATDLRAHWMVKYEVEHENQIGVRDGDMIKVQ